MVNVFIVQHIGILVFVELMHANMQFVICWQFINRVAAAAFSQQKWSCLINLVWLAYFIGFNSYIIYRLAKGEETCLGTIFIHDLDVMMITNIIQTIQIVFSSIYLNRMMKKQIFALTSNNNFIEQMMSRRATKK
jgi:hypothetical protein